MSVMETVREGMHVVDKRGDAVGSVKELQMGDPGASTASEQGTSSQHQDYLGRALGSSTQGVSPEEADRLLRVGYIKVSRNGLFTGNLLVGADEISSVEGDTVYLAINGDDRTT